MSSLLAKIFRRGAETHNQADELYHKARAEADEFIDRLKELSAADEPVCQLFADLWQFRKNVPVVTTMYEAHQEMMSAVKQR